MRLSNRPSLRRALAVASAAASLVLAAPASAAADNVRSSCTPHPSGDSGDGFTLALTKARPVNLVTWDVRWWQRHRFWITLQATNKGASATTLLADVMVDRQGDEPVMTDQPATPLVLAPHASVTQRLTLYVPDDAKTVGVRLGSNAADTDVSASLGVECSEARFDAGKMSPAATTLLDEALKLYFAEAVDPMQNTRTAFDTVSLQASGAQDGFDVAWALRALMLAAHDSQGFVRLPGDPVPPVPVLEPRAPTLDLRADGTAVLRLFQVVVQSDAERQAYAERLHELVAAALARHPRAWVIDLREHGGGDMWGSLAPLTSLLGGPSIGAFVTRAGREEWIADRGVVRLAGGAPLIDLQSPPEAPFAGPVAVLIGPGTRDEGEAVAIAFEGREHTRFFGSDTPGRIASQLQLHTLSDGSTLGIVGMRYVDRAGVVYRGPIKPDAPADSHGDDAQVPAKVLEWVLDEHADGVGVR